MHSHTGRVDKKACLKSAMAMEEPLTPSSTPATDALIKKDEENMMV